MSFSARWRIASIKRTYPNTEASGDGQVVVVTFSDGMRFELAPSFEISEGRFRCPNSNGGGAWYVTDPRAEQSAINQKNALWNWNLKRLARMARAWKRTWNVPIGGLLIDTFAHSFLADWQYKDKSFLYYDWISRDFFGYLMNRNPSQSLCKCRHRHRSGDVARWNPPILQELQLRTDRAVSQGDRRPPLERA